MSEHLSKTSCLDDVSQAAAVLRVAIAAKSPICAIVLGSGFSGLVDALIDPISVPYGDLPGFMPAGVDGHAGVVYCGQLCGREVLVFSGRYHLYEGYSAWQVTALARLAAACGCRHILLTNAAGGIADDMAAGDFMLVSDHINLSGAHPLIGRPEFGFPDLHGLYRIDFFDDLQEQLMQQYEVKLHCGVLAWLSGPSYETPAEIRMLEALGCSGVSMSTVPEAIVAHTLGLKVVALSFIANQAAGKCPHPLNHLDVLTEAGRAEASALAVVGHVLTCLQ